MNATNTFLKEMAQLSNDLLKKIKTEFDPDAFEAYLQKRETEIQAYKEISRNNNDNESSKLYEHLKELDSEIADKAKIYMHDLENSIKDHKAVKVDHGQKIQNLKKVKNYFKATGQTTSYFIDKKK